MTSRACATSLGEALQYVKGDRQAIHTGEARDSRPQKRVETQHEKTLMECNKDFFIICMLAKSEESTYTSQPIQAWKVQEKSAIQASRKFKQ